MTWIRVAGLVGAVLFSAATARADKTAEAFVDPSSLAGGAFGFKNAIASNFAAKTYSVGALKQSGCKLKFQFKGLTGFADGEKMICLAGADANLAAFPLPTTPSVWFGNTIVVHVPYSTLTLKAASKADPADIGCGGPDATAINASTSCYKWSATYNPATTCAGQGGLWLANLTFVTGQELTDGLVGVCQWFNPAGGERLTPPATGLVARDGVTTRDTTP